MSDDPLLGAEVGRYRLVRLLGKGGMGRVYEGVQPDLGARVAIKVLSEDAADRPDLVERFFAEARAVNLIRHESIVGVIDLIRMANGRPVIIMDLVEGRTLRDVLRAGRPPLGGLVQVMIDVLSALAAAHAVGVIHRDLKPDNVMITASGRAKVLDFGIAKLAANLLGATPRTQTGSVLGTPPYMSPEQVSGATVDARSDVYTAGVVLFECVAGGVPFEGSDFAVMRAHLERPPPSLRALRPDLPQALEDVILCALAKEPRRRFASAAAMANALHAASAALVAGEWRGLGADGRMFPRSPAPPLPVSPEPDPAASLSGPTRADRPTPAAGPTRVDRPTPPGAPQQPTTAERPSSRSRPRAGRRWARIAVPLGAACVGGAIVAAVFAMHGGSRGGPTLQDTRESDVTASTELPAPLPPDYDPHRFDPVGYIAKAREHARGLYPDAEMISATFANILPTGADERSQIVYLFRSPSRSQGGGRCLVLVSAGAQLQVLVPPVPQCGDPFFVPRCTFAELRARAAEAGLDADARTSISGVRDQWVIQGQRADRSQATILISNSCDRLAPPDHPAPTPVDAGVAVPAPPPRVAEAPRDAGPPPDGRPPPRDAALVVDGPPPDEGGEPPLTYHRTASRVELPMDGYDPHHFDPSAYLARAEAHGNELTRNGVVFALLAMGVRPDGTVDFNPAGGGRQGNVRFDVHGTREPCSVVVIPTHAWIVVWKDSGASECGGKVAPRPRCTLRQVWARARAAGMATTAATALIEYRLGKWHFEGQDEGGIDFDDSCP